jgi:hypothetical protein
MFSFTPERAGTLYADCSSHMAYDVEEVLCAGMGQVAVRYCRGRRAGWCMKKLLKEENKLQFVFS